MNTSYISQHDGLSLLLLLLSAEHCWHEPRWTLLGPLITHQDWKHFSEYDWKACWSCTVLHVEHCNGWDELNKILYGFEYWDLLKTFQATHSQIFQSHIHPSLHFPLLGKLGRVVSVMYHEVFQFFFPHFTFTACFIQCEHSVNVQCIWTGGSASCPVITTIQHLSLLSVPGLAKIHNQSVPVADRRQKDYAWEFKHSVSVIHK